ncbi:hypothetical protein [Paenibacillus eucommiae]|uniref:Uncharacterized protein n=1 Tax=Paenibacillus eucommiae TaxID=1355755 RepID=A0ABS4IW05_9BACL|nr:hypothetical protein [Paenibacillus eucommiae]MBP1991776.1 hypothetical protein [Paenibacillus eucommiae]
MERSMSMMIRAIVCFVLDLTMFLIVKASVSRSSVTIMMIFIVKRGRMASQGG